MCGSEEIMLKSSFRNVPFCRKVKGGMILLVAATTAFGTAFYAGAEEGKIVEVDNVAVLQNQKNEILQTEEIVTMAEESKKESFRLSEQEIKEMQEAWEQRIVFVKNKMDGSPEPTKEQSQENTTEQKVQEEVQLEYETLFATQVTSEMIFTAVCEDMEEETLQLMSSPAGTTSYGYIKAYAGTTPLIITQEDKEVLLRIVEAEATGEDVKGRMLVANVILNRVLSPKFPDTITDVVFQNNGKTYQFSPIKDGRYWSVTVSEKTKEAVERVLNGEDYSQGALYFAARKLADKKNMSWFDRELTRLFQYGVHEFFID